MIEYLDNEIVFLEEKLGTTQVNSPTYDSIKVEKELLESHRKLYMAWLSKNKLNQPLGSVIIVENTMEYLRGFRDGVLKAKS